MYEYLKNGIKLKVVSLYFVAIKWRNTFWLIKYNISWVINFNKISYLLIHWKSIEKLIKQNSNKIKEMFVWIYAYFELI